MAAAVDCKITSRVLRRSQITALWNDNASPEWRSKVAAQCCHSLETVRRYYEFSDKIVPGMEVVEALRNLREKSTPQFPHPCETEDKSEVEDEPETDVPPQEDTTAEQEKTREVTSLPSAPTSSEVISKVTTVAEFPEQLSLGTLESELSTSLSLPQEEKSDSAKVYNEIASAVKKCNMSRDANKYVVNWSKVLTLLAEKDPTYRSWNKEKVRDKFKYLNKVRKSLQ